jgi:antitoxin (DNA-binding transcriptional repressor) of toxin-antitoxin stability system
VLHAVNVKRVGIRELRRNLSAYLRDVAAGETFEVTNRGRAVALLRPHPASHGAAALLGRQGRVARTARRSLADMPSATARRLHEPLLADVLDAERGERL